MNYGWIRLQYALLFAVLGGYLPYMPIYVHEQGFADWQIGWVMGVYGLAVMVMPLLMTHLADRRLSNRALIGMGYLVAAGALVGVAAMDTFATLILLSLLFSLGYTPMFSLSDGMTFSAMRDQERSGGRAPAYHTVRIWGSVGFLVPSLLLFFVLRYTAATTAGAIFVSAGAALLGSAVSRRLPATRPGGGGKRGLPGAEAWRAVVRPPVRSMMGPMMLLFFAISIFYAFYSRHLQNLGVSPEWVGLIVNVGVLAEVALMLAAGLVLRRVGIKGVMVIGAAAMVLRLGLLAALETVPVAVATQLLHAPIVLCLYLVPPMYLNQKASGSDRNSMQGLFGVLCFGLARLMGSVLGGYVAGYGLRMAFVLGAAAALAALVWLVIGFADQEASEALGGPRATRSAAPSKRRPLAGSTGG